MSVSQPLRRYWDSSCFLALINEEEGADACERVLNEARQANTEIFVSPMVQVEVVRPRGSSTPLPLHHRQTIKSFFENDYLKWRMIDRKVADDAQQLCWEHGLHPRDAIHLAVALDLQCHYLETFDKDLLKLDQKVPSTTLRISRPGSLGQQSLW